MELEGLYVPTREVQFDTWIRHSTLDFVVVRSDKERIAVGLDIAPVEQPERVEN